MLKHIVMWKLKDSAEGNTQLQNAELMKEKLSSLKGKIKELKQISVGINSSKAPAENCQVVLITEFENFAAMDIYQNHPEHQKVVSFIKAVCCERRAIDFEI